MQAEGGTSTSAPSLFQPSVPEEDAWLSPIAGTGRSSRSSAPTRGAKSGEERINPLAYLRDGDRYVVFASKGGAPTNPDWYHNVGANPEVTVEVGTETIKGRAHVATDPERTDLWTRQVAAMPAFGEYEMKSGRTIPVIVIEPI